MYTFVFKFELHMGQRDIKIINQSINQKLKKAFRLPPLILLAQGLYRTPDFVNCL